MRTILLAVAVALVAASTAVAAPPPGKGNTKTTTGAPPCTPVVAVVLTGTLDHVAGQTLFMKVTGGNASSKAYKAQTQPIPIVIANTTAINRRGDHNVAHLQAHDRLNVQARICKTNLGQTLTATRITAHPAKA